VLHMILTFTNEYFTEQHASIGLYCGNMVFRAVRTEFVNI
jgi:hypothetical protein